MFEDNDAGLFEENESEQDSEYQRELQRKEELRLFIEAQKTRKNVALDDSSSSEVESDNGYNENM